MNKNILYLLALLSITTSPIHSSNFIERNAGTLLCVTAAAGIGLGGTLVYWHQQEVQQEERNELYDLLRKKNNLQGYDQLRCKTSSDKPVASDELKEAAEKVLSNFQETLNKKQKDNESTQHTLQDERRTKERLERESATKNALIAKLQEEVRVKTPEEQQATIETLRATVRDLESKQKTENELHEKQLKEAKAKENSEITVRHVIQIEEQGMDIPIGLFHDKPLIPLKRGLLTSSLLQKHREKERRRNSNTGLYAFEQSFFP